MREQGIGKVELARRLGWHLSPVERTLDVEHNSRLNRIDAALGVIEKGIMVQAKDDTQTVS